MQSGLGSKWSAPWLHMQYSPWGAERRFALPCHSVEGSRKRCLHQHRPPPPRLLPRPLTLPHTLRPLMSMQ